MIPAPHSAAGRAPKGSGAIVLEKAGERVYYRLYSSKPARLWLGDFDRKDQAARVRDDLAEGRAPRYPLGVKLTGECA